MADSGDTLWPLRSCRDSSLLSGGGSPEPHHHGKDQGYLCDKVPTHGIYLDPSQGTAMQRLSPLTSPETKSTISQPTRSPGQRESMTLGKGHSVVALLSELMF